MSCSFLPSQNSRRATWNELQTNAARTNRCPQYFKKAYDQTVAPLKKLKTSRFYQWLSNLTNDNLDFVFLAKVIFVVVGTVLIYFLYFKLAKYRSAIFSQELLTNQLMTMNTSDLPMAEITQAQNEVQALHQHAKFFENHPFSEKQMGGTDLTRGVLVLPIINFFIIYVLPICALIYIIWFIYNYIGYIARAIYGFITEVMIQYMTRFVVCKIASIIPFFHFPCPSLYDYLMKWKKEYIDKPIYIEKMKYFRFYYLQKKRLSIPITKLDQQLDNYRVQADYGQKFISRCKDVFYQHVVNAQDHIGRQQNSWNDQLSSWNDNLSQASDYLKSWGDQEKPCDGENPNESSSSAQDRWEKACQRIDQMYSATGMITSLLVLILAIGILYFFVFYAITGKPDFVHQAIGPMYRFNEHLKFISSQYNWLAIGGLISSLVMLTWLVGSESHP